MGEEKPGPLRPHAKKGTMSNDGETGDWSQIIAAAPERVQCCVKSKARVDSFFETIDVLYLVQSTARFGQWANGHGVRGS